MVLLLLLQVVRHVGRLLVRHRGRARGGQVAGAHAAAAPGCGRRFGGAFVSVRGVRRAGGARVMAMMLAGGRRWVARLLLLVRAGALNGPVRLRWVTCYMIAGYMLTLGYFTIVYRLHDVFTKFYI